VIESKATRPATAVRRRVHSAPASSQISDGMLRAAVHDREPRVYAVCIRYIKKKSSVDSLP
jgi:type III secretory pathway component EscU